MYVIVAHITPAFPFPKGAVNVRTLNSARNGAPKTIHGLKRPHLDLVRSAIPPIIGSLIPSHIFATIMIVDTAIGASPTMSI